MLQLINLSRNYLYYHGEPSLMAIPWHVVTLFGQLWRKQWNIWLLGSPLQIVVHASASCVAGNFHTIRNWTDGLLKQRVTDAAERASKSWLQSAYTQPQFKWRRPTNEIISNRLLYVLFARYIPSSPRSLRGRTRRNGGIYFCFHQVDPNCLPLFNDECCCERIGSICDESRQL